MTWKIGQGSVSADDGHCVVQSQNWSRLLEDCDGDERHYRPTVITVTACGGGGGGGRGAMSRWKSVGGHPFLMDISNKYVLCYFPFKIVWPIS